jgi:hypothetical protein
MPALRHLFVLLIAACCALPAFADGAFVAGTNDLPLMPGLTEIDGTSTVFDKPSGRIVEAYATGKGLSTADLVKFYVATLPQLGWRRGGDLYFERGKEQLLLTPMEDGGRLTVRFNLSPLTAH